MRILRKWLDKEPAFEAVESAGEDDAALDAWFHSSGVVVLDVDAGRDWLGGAVPFNVYFEHAAEDAREEARDEVRDLLAHPG